MAAADTLTTDEAWGAPQDATLTTDEAWKPKAEVLSTAQAWGTPKQSTVRNLTPAPPDSTLTIMKQAGMDALHDVGGMAESSTGAMLHGLEDIGSGIKNFFSDPLQQQAPQFLPEIPDAGQQMMQRGQQYANQSQATGLGRTVGRKVGELAPPVALGVATGGGLGAAGLGHAAAFGGGMAVPAALQAPSGQRMDAFANNLAEGTGLSYLTPLMQFLALGGAKSLMSGGPSDEDLTNMAMMGGFHALGMAGEKQLPELAPATTPEQMGQGMPLRQLPAPRELPALPGLPERPMLPPPAPTAENVTPQQFSVNPAGEVGTQPYPYQPPQAPIGFDEMPPLELFNFPEIAQQQLPEMDSMVRRFTPAGTPIDGHTPVNGQLPEIPYPDVPLGATEPIAPQTMPGTLPDLLRPNPITPQKGAPANVQEVNPRAQVAEQGIQPQAGNELAPAEVRPDEGPTGQEGLLNQAQEIPPQEVQSAPASAPDAVSEKAVPVLTPQGADAKPPFGTADFDPEAFDRKYKEGVKASKEAGNTHLDSIPAAVETMRGKRVRHVVTGEEGVITTVDNRGNIYAKWEKFPGSEDYVGQESMLTDPQDHYALIGEPGVKLNKKSKQYEIQREGKPKPPPEPAQAQGEAPKQFENLKPPMADSGMAENQKHILGDIGNISFKDKWFVPLERKLSKSEAKKYIELSAKDEEFMSPAEIKTYKNLKNIEKGNRGVKLQDVIDAPKLFENHPYLKEVLVHRPFGEATGSHSTHGIGIPFSHDESALPILLHEITHRVQMEKGGKGGEFYSGDGTDKAFQDYKNSPEEIEARASAALIKKKTNPPPDAAERNLNEGPRVIAQNLTKQRANEIVKENGGGTVEPDPMRPKKWRVSMFEKGKGQRGAAVNPAELIASGVSKAVDVAESKTRALREGFGRPEAAFDSTLHDVESKSTPKGSEARAMLDDAETLAHAIVGKHLTLLEDADKGLSWGDRHWMAKDAHFKQAVESGKKMPNLRIQAYADAWRKVTDSQANLAETQKYKVYDPSTGAERDFERIPNYFPHLLTRDARNALVDKKGPLFDAIVEAAKVNGIDEKTLLQLANPPDTRTTKSRNLEFARVADLPDAVTINGKRVPVLETNPFDVLPQHIERAARRLGFTKIFGTTGAQAKAVDFAKAIKEESGSAGEEAFTDAFKGVQGISEPSGKISRMLNESTIYNAMENVARTAQLSLGTISNAIQGPTPIIAKYGLARTIKAGAIDGLETLERYSKKLTGGTPTERMELLQHLRRMRGWDEDALGHSFVTEDMRGKIGKLSRTALKATGFNWINKHLNRVAAIAANDSLMHAVDYLRNPKEGSLRKYWGQSPDNIRQMLRTEFGFSPGAIDRMVSTGIKGIDAAKAVQHASAKTNLYNESALVRPRWMNGDSARRFMAYSSYVRAMGNATTDAIFYAKHGNWAPLTRLVVGAGVAGIAAEKVRDLFVKKEREDTGFWDKIGRGLMSSGIAGMPGYYANNLYYGIKMGRPLSSAFVGIPMLDWYGQIAGDAVKAAKLKRAPQDAMSKLGRAAVATGKGIVKYSPALKGINAQLGNPVGLKPPAKH